MALVYDQLGNIIGDDGTPDIPTQPSVDAMKYELQQKSTRPQMSIAEAGSNFLGNASNVLKDYEKKLGLTNLKNIVGQIPAVKAVQPLAEVPISMALSPFAAAAYGYVPPGSPRSAYDEAQAKAAAIQYQSTNPYTNQMLEDLGETFKGMPAYIPTAGAFRPRVTDAQVLKAQALATGKEIADIPADFSMAKQGLKRMDAEGKPTFGVSAQQLADEFGDYLERQKSRGKPSVSILGANDLMPDMNAYIVKGKSSPTWNANAAKQAEELAAKGVPDNIIHQGLGVWKGPDNKSRQEISNYDASVNSTKLNEISTKNAAAMDAGNFATLKIPYVLNHTEFFDAYPEAKNLEIAFGDLNSLGAYSHAAKTVYINRKIMDDPVLMIQVIVHELTHHVQNVEGFERGGSEREFPDYKVADTAQDLEIMMSNNKITLPEAVAKYTSIFGKAPSDEAIAYAERGQGNATTFTHPRDRYDRIFGEAEARSMADRIDIKPEDLQKYYPLNSADKGLDVNLKDTMLRIPGSSNFISSGQFKNQGYAFNPTVAQMKHALTNKPSGLSNAEGDDKVDMPTNDVQIISQGPSDDASMAIKERGGNWPDSRLDTMLRQRLLDTLPSLFADPINRFELASNWEEKADDIGYSPEQKQRLITSNALNQWLSRRLKNYIKNDLGTPKDPVRDLADQGITHINDLGEFANDLESNLVVDSVIGKARKAQGQPAEGFATTALGRDWESRSDFSISPQKLRDWIDMNPSGAARNIGIEKALEKDPNAKMNTLDSSSIEEDLGFGHLTDELYNAIRADSDLPQHLQLSIKDLERMTVPEAVRLVAKINKYRKDLAEKATVKNVAEFRQNFPAILQFEDGSSWHQLQLPDIKHELPEGYSVQLIKHVIGQGDMYGIVDKDGKVYDYTKEEDKEVGYRPLHANSFSSDQTQGVQKVLDAYSEFMNMSILDRALTEEGELMGHCVGGYTDEVADGSSSIFTLRDAKGKPHVTIESMPYTYTNSNGESERDPDGPYAITQIKGKENRGVVPRYRQQVIDFLNSLPDDKLKYVEEIRNVDAVEPATLDTVRGGADIVNAIKKYVPDLPRFISRDKWTELVNKYYVNNDRAGFKDGGKVNFEDAKLPIRAHNREFETPDLMKARDIGLTGDYQGKSLTLGRQQMRRDFDDSSKLKRDMDYMRYSQPMLEGRFNAMAMKDPTSPAYQGMAQYEQPFMGGTAGIGAMAIRTPEEELRLKALQLMYNKQLNNDSSLSGMANFPIDGASPMVGVQYRSRFADGGAVSVDEMKYALMRKHNA